MSLLFFDGFQDANTMSKPEWSNSGWASFAGRDGSSAGAASLGASVFRLLTLSTPATTCIVGVASNLATSSAFGHAQARTIGFHRGATLECMVIVNTSGMIELRRTSPTGTLLATSSGHAPITANSWHSYQAKVVLHATSGSAEVKLDSATVLTYSGQTAGTTGDVTALSMACGFASSQYWDDLWVCDGVDATATQGAANNDFLGDLKVATLVPTGAGDSTQFTPSTGANWSCVDDVPANTTDYVSTATSANRDLYAMSNLPAGATSPKAIRIGTYAQKTDAGASSVKPVIKESGGTVTTQAAVALSTSWVPYYGPILYQRPSDSAVWSESDLNGLQVGIELA